MNNGTKSVVDQKIKFSKDEKIRCNAIIHPASLSAAAVGAKLAQLPVVDAAVIIPIQTGMIVSLGLAFGMKIDDAVVKGIVKSFAAAFAGRKLSQVLVGWIPIKGNIVNAATAASLTEAIGWYSARRFKKLQSDANKLNDSETLIKTLEKESCGMSKKFHETERINRGEIEEYKKVIEEINACIQKCDSV